MKARYRYRFYPTKEQKTKLAQLFGCIRIVWNDALARCQSAGKALSYNKLSSLLTIAKKSEERMWLRDVSAVPLQQTLRNLAKAYRNCLVRVPLRLSPTRGRIRFFNSCKGKRKGKKVKPPRFKKRSNQQSAAFAKSAF